MKRAREKGLAFTGTVTCPDCGKVRYGSRKQAKAVARRMSRRQRVYQCGGFWHTTSWDPAGKVIFYRERRES